MSGMEWQDDIVLTFAWNDELEDVYASYRHEVAAAERVHALAGERLKARHAILGAVLIVASAIAAAGAFALLGADRAMITGVGLDEDDVLVLVGSAASVATVLAGTLLLLRYPARAERHRIAALRYGSLAREIEGTLAIPRAARREPDRALVDARERIDRYAKSSPPVARRVRRQIQRASVRSRPSTAPVVPSFVFPDGRSVAGA